MRKCNKCEQEFADEFNFCPHCGEAYTVEQPTQDKTVDNNVKGSIMDKKCAKLAQFERNNHCIQSAVIFAMSLIMFICSFFAGGLIEVYFDTSYAIVPQTIYQIVDGEVAYIDNSTVEDNVMGYALAERQAYQKLREEYGGYMPEYTTFAEYEAFMSKYGKYMAESGFNFCRYTAACAKLYVKQSDYYVPAGINYICGAIATIPMIAMQICFSVTTLVYAIKSLTALIKRKRLDNPFKMITLPFTFILLRLFAFVIHPSMRIDGMGIALIVISVLSMLLISAYKIIFKDSSRAFSIASLAKKLTLLALGCIVFFVACGPIYNLTNAITDFGNNIVYPVGENNILFDGVLSYYKDGYYPSAFYTVVAISLIYFVLFAIGVKFAISLFKSFIGGDTSSIKSPLKQTKSCAIAMIVFLILILALTVLLGKVVSSVNVAYPQHIAISINTVVSLIACIALLIVDKAWKVRTKQVENEQTEIA